MQVNGLAGGSEKRMASMRESLREWRAYRSSISIHCKVSMRNRDTHTEGFKEK
jgi:hypothetical protein